MDVYGTFWFFAAFTFLGFLFVKFFVKETRGLTDIAKKNLYVPVNLTKPAAN